MTTFQVAFRLHGPIQISTKYDFGDAKLYPKESVEGISGILEFNFEAEDRDEAKEIADNSLAEKARTIAGALAFTFEEGIAVGDRYKVTAADAEYKERLDTTLKADSRFLSIAEEIYRNSRDTIESDERIKRAINWYCYGLSTEAPEDRLVAFWTGAESLVDKRTIDMDLTEAQRDSIHEAKEGILGNFDSDHSSRGWVSGHFGSLLTGTRTEDDEEAVLRVAKEKIDRSQFSDNIEDVVETVYQTRNAIVHQGMHIEDATSKANLAEHLLRELLIAYLPNAFANFITEDIPDRLGIPTVYFNEALPIVFEDSYDLTLDRDEINKRLFAITRDLQEAYRFPPQAFAGKNEPLLETDEGTFRLNPEYDFEERR